MKDHITSLDQAKALIKNNITYLGTELYTLDNSVGRIIGEDIQATIDQQPFDNSAMDGYAINSLYTNEATSLNTVSFNILDNVIAAGSQILSYDKFVDKIAVKIMTGAPIPKGLDAVIPIEEATILNNNLIVKKAYKKLHNIRLKGEDFKVGDVLAKKGSIISPQVALLLKTSGINEVNILKQPKAAIITSGTEFNNENEPLLEGKIYNSNATFLVHFLKLLNFNVTYLGNISDNKYDLKRLIELHAKNYDLIVSSGGVSKGDFDIIPETLKDYGKILYHFLYIRPGKPNLLVKLNNGTLWFGLPGNPVSTVIAARILVYYYYLCIHYKVESPIYARLRHDVIKKPNLIMFYSGNLQYNEGILEFETTKKQGSHIISSLKTNAIAELGSKDYYPADSLVPIHILNPFFANYD